jgi:hypothetical protein
MIHMKPGTFAETQKGINKGYNKVFVVSVMEADSFAFTECESLMEAKKILPGFVRDGLKDICVEVFVRR